MTQSTASGSANVALDTRYRVRFDEAGADERVHPAVLLAWAQDAAWLHSTALGFGRDWYTERGLTWLVRAAELRLVDPPSSGDEVAVRTEIVGFRRVLARRLTTARSTDGRELARSLTDWALTDGRGRATRIPEVFTRLAAVPSFEPLSVTPAPADARVIGEVTVPVRLRDADPLGHANNSAILSYVDEVLAAVDQREEGRLPTVYRLVYLRPAPTGTELSARVRRLGARSWLELRSSGGDAVATAAVE